MASLLRNSNRSLSINLFESAIRMRPNDWRLPNALAEAYLSDGKVWLALEALVTAARLLPDTSFEKSKICSDRGKVLFNLKRFDEAKTCFLKSIQDYERIKDQLSPLDKAHHINGEYILCVIYTLEENPDKYILQETWDNAEKKRRELSPEVRQRVGWEARQYAQSEIWKVDSSLLKHQDCCHCRKFVPDPKTCTGCRVAVYCSRTCQKIAWKSGHREECSQLKKGRKEREKQPRKYRNT